MENRYGPIEMNRFYQLILVALFFSICCSAKTTTYLIGTEDIEFYPHYGKLSADSYEFEGYARLFFDDFALKKNVSIEYVPQPIKRLYISLLVNKNIDFKYPDSPTWNINQKAKSSNKIYYSNPIISYIDGIFVHRDNVNFTLNDITVLGVIRGFTPEPFIDEIKRQKINLIEYSRSDHLLMALEAKRVSAVYINADVANYLIKSKGISNLVFKKDLPFTQGKYHLSTIKHPEIIKLMNQYIKENSADIQKLAEKLLLTSRNQPYTSDKPNSVNQ